MVWRTFYSEVVPLVAIVATECASVGSNTLFKAASLEGLSYFVFITYSYAINTLLLLPIAFLFSRKTNLPPSSFQLYWRVCLLGLLGLSAHIAGYKGIQYSSPTLSAAMNNLSPAFTFILAIIFRMEKVELRSSSFGAKFIGTVVSISGASVVVFYRGPPILPIFPTPTLSLQSSSQSHWIVGGLLLLLNCLLFALWFIVLTNTMKLYPAELVVSFLHCLCVTILSIPVGLLSETNLKAWRPTSHTSLIALLYSGCFGPAFLTVVHSWSLHLKGPVYVSILKPCSIAIAVVMGVIFLGDDLYLGSVIGAVILCSGVYAVIWGKAKESGSSSCSSLGSSQSCRTPLLQKEDV